MGCRPFVTATNNLLRDTEPYYSQGTDGEGRRKFRRVGEILEGLKAEGRIHATSPGRLAETEIDEFVGWLKGNLDATAGAHYLKFPDEILQSVGNDVVSRLKVKKRHLLPQLTAKSIRTIPNDCLERLWSYDYAMEDDWWDAAGKAAIALFSHSGLPSSEVRLAKLKDLNLSRMEITVSSSKGMHRWTNGTEVSPIMEGREFELQEYLPKEPRDFEP